MTEKHPAVTVAKRQGQDDTDWILNETYLVQYRFVPVAAGLIQEATQQLEEPPVPVVFLEEKGREEENPNDPQYLRDMETFRQKQTQVAIDTMVMFGVVLDDLPEDDTWIRRLKLLQKRGGGVDLSWVDWEDEIDLEFVFKRYALLSSSDLVKVGRLTGISEEAVTQAAQGFRRPDSRESDQ